jgi:methylisocitrate lyase
VGARFRELLRSAEPVQGIAVFDPPSARLVEMAGYPAIFVGGSDIALTKGFPDVGLVSMTEMIAFAAPIIEQVGIPVLADADNGGGPPAAVYRTMKAFARAGAAAVMFEDRIRAERIGQRSAVSAPPWTPGPTRWWWRAATRSPPGDR